MLVFVGIVSIVFGISIMGYRSNVLGEAYVGVQADARRAMDQMVAELRQAGTVSVLPGAPPNPPDNILEFQTNLGVGAPCGAGVTCWGAVDQAGAPQAGWRIHYRRNAATNQILREILDAGGISQPGTRVMVNNATQLTFTFNPPPLNSITAQLQIGWQTPDLPGGTLTASPTPLVFEVRLRN
jgi:hypothetical protein